MLAFATCRFPSSDDAATSRGRLPRWRCRTSRSTRRWRSCARQRGRNSLSRMGVHLPLFVIHDIGVMLSMSRGAGGYVLRAARELSSPGSSCRRAPSRSSSSIAGCSTTSRARRSPSGSPGCGCATRWSRCCCRGSSATRTTAGAIARKSSGRRGAAARSRHPRRDRLRRSLPRLRSARPVGLRRAPRRAVEPRLHAGRADRSRYRAAARPVQGRQRVGQRGARRRDRSRRSVRRARLARGQRRRELLARSVAERARDPALDRRADVCGRWLRVDRAQGQHRFARAVASSRTTARSSSRRSSTTSCSTTAATSSARTSAGCSTS